MPSTPFRGVRISWLMVARKVDLARLAASASSLAWTRAASACLRAVMFCMAPNSRRGAPAASRTSLTVQATQTSRPSSRATRYSGK